MIWTNLPSTGPKHREERLKLAANGLQALGLTILATMIIGPALNPALATPLFERILAGLSVGECELVAFLLLGYIPTPSQGTTP